MSTFASDPGGNTQAIYQVAEQLNQAADRPYKTAAVATVLTAAEIINGMFFLTGTPGAVDLTTPSAAAIVAAIENCRVGSSFEFWVNNAGDGTITVVAGDGVTLVGTTTVATNKARRYTGRVTAVGTPAVSLYGVLLGDK